VASASPPLDPGCGHQDPGRQRQSLARVFASSGLEHVPPLVYEAANAPRVRRRRESLKAAASGSRYLLDGCHSATGSRPLLGTSPQIRRIATAGPPLPEPDVRPFSAPAAAGPLTPRESELLQLLADGLTNKEIARRLSIPEETTNTRVRRLLAKLQARTRAHAVALGLRRHLLRRPPAASTRTAHGPGTAAAWRYLLHRVRFGVSFDSRRSAVVDRHLPSRAYTLIRSPSALLPFPGTEHHSRDSAGRCPHQPAPSGLAHCDA
jgi:DNA-binding CsgD family transcriptional regulator